MAIRGVFPDVPWLSLEKHLDLEALTAVHDEVCLALTQMPVDYTGGSHRSMDIMPASRRAEAHGDYGEVIRSLSAEDFTVFRSLSDDPSVDDRDVGEEKEHPLSRRQMLWLKYRHKVYFPWKVYAELIPNRYWGDKATPKDFSRIAKTLFPKTIAFVKSLPFLHVGRCNVMGLEANDHGTVHRDGDPDEQEAPDHFITFCPAGDKRLFLWDEDAKAKHAVSGRAYWFNDHDYHGVDADPFFRYSIRVDGVFRPDFLETLEQ